MARPTRRSIAMKQSWAIRKSKHVKVPPTAELDDLRVQARKYLNLIEDGMAMVNEGWDGFNSLPKRIPKG